MPATLQIEAKENRKPDNAQYERFRKGDQIPFAFTFPLCDLLICELENPPVYQLPLLPSVSHDTEVGSRVRYLGKPWRIATKVSRVALYIYQRVISRKIVPFQPSPEKSPGYLLAYVEETLECGHKVTVYPIDGEHFTARKRSCHECSGQFGGLILPKKKPSVAALRQPRKRQAGKVNWWAIGFAFCSAAAVAIVLIVKTPATKILLAPETYVRVLHQYNAYDFQLQEVVHGVPQQPSVWHFCHDFAPQFEAGYTLTQLKWFDNGSCSEIAPRYIHHAYHIERDKGGLPTVPRNCINTSDQPVFCNGEPKF